MTALGRQILGTVMRRLPAATSHARPSRVTSVLLLRVLAGAQAMAEGPQLLVLGVNFAALLLGGCSALIAECALAQ